MNDDTQQPIAVVGMACRFPKAPHLQAYLSNLVRGVDAVGPIPQSHWRASDYVRLGEPQPDFTYCERGAFLEPTDFEPLRYGLTPRAVEATDTTQLFGLLVAEEALADAGYVARPDGGSANNLDGETGSDRKTGWRGRPFDRDRTSVILGVTGALELVVPLGARLGHPHWRRALAAGGIPDDVAKRVIDQISDSYVGWQEASFPGLLGNVTAGRIANRLDLHGTNCVVDAACASALSAVHLAMLELRTGRSDLVLSGGVDTFNDIFMYMCFSQTPALSPTGDARPFSTDGDGTILGEGVGVLALRRLADAKRDGDRIYAVLKGMGTGSDGAGEAIYAPSVAGQARTLRRAYADAGVSPRSVGLVEAHGTGTVVGDQVEATALCEVYEKAAGDGGTDGSIDEDDASRAPAWCTLGSVKSQIGHTKAAAGVASLIKAALALHHKVLPPTLKLKGAVPRLMTPGAPFVLSDRARPWLAPSGAHPRRAGVSAFGFGGSNFHCVLEEADGHVERLSDGTTHREADERADGQADGRADGRAGGRVDGRAGGWADERTILGSDSIWDESLALFCLSAGSRQALRQDLVALQAHTDWASLRRAAEQRRLQFTPEATHRLCFVWLQKDHSTDAWHHWLGRLGDWLAAGSLPPTSTITHQGWRAVYGMGAPPGPVAVLFPGQGSQYSGMGRAWACRFGLVRRAVETFEAKRRSQWLSLGPDGASDGGMPESPEHGLGDVIWPALVAPPPTNGRKPISDNARLAQTCWAQPALGAIEAGIFGVLSALGLRPEIFAGHSFGELVALWAAGCCDLDTLADLSVRRGLLMHNANSAAAHVHDIDPAASGGGMLAVVGPAERLARVGPSLCKQLGLSCANDNAPDQVVWSGSKPALQQAKEALRGTGLRGVMLPVGGAFHSPLIQTAADRFAQDVRAASWLAPTESHSRSNPVVLSNELGAPYPSLIPSEVATRLCNHMQSSVRFVDMVDAIARRGADTIVEVGPSQVLTGLARRNLQTDKPDADGPGLCAVDAGRGSEGLSLESLGQVVCALAARGHLDNVAFWDNSSSTKMPSCGASQVQGRSESAFVLSICGANYRSPSTTRERPLETATTLEQGAFEGEPMSDQDDFRSEALAAVIKLQEQSAKAHDAFLASQREAQQSIAALAGLSPRTPEDSNEVAVAGQDQRTEKAGAGLALLDPAVIPAMGSASPELSPDATERTLTEPGHVDDDMAAQWTADGDHGGNATDDVHADVVADASHAADTTARIDVVDAETLVREVISEKTGYPTPMLQGHLALDRDLGIDSIKRVEIVAALRDALPNLPEWSADTLSQLRTLDDIVAALRDQLGTRAAVPGSPQSEDEATASEVTADAASAIVGDEDQRWDATAELVLDVLADKTGYPHHVLKGPMQLSRDLGIDSIKRVEILAALSGHFPELGALQEAHDSKVSDIDTVDQLIAVCRGDAVNVGPLAPSVEMAASEAQPDHQVTSDAVIPTTASAMMPSDGESSTPVVGDTLRRRVLKLIAAGGDGHGHGLTVAMPDAAERFYWITDDGRGVAHALGNALHRLGARTKVVEWDDASAPDHAEGATVTDVVFLAGPHFDHTRLQHALRHLRSLGLNNLTATGDPLRLATISAIDGCFGLSAEWSAQANMTSAGLHGMAKSAVLEWQRVQLTCIDLDPRWDDVTAVADRLVHTLAAGASDANGDGEVVKFQELGLQEHASWRLTAEVAPLADDTKLDGERLPTVLNDTDLVLVTGGARGVTATVAQRLAQETGAALLLLGRTARNNEPEPEWLADLTGEREIKAALAAHLADDDAMLDSATGVLQPQSLQQAYQAVCARRSVEAQERSLAEAGVTAIYRAVDVRDPKAVRTALDEAEETLGRKVSACVHGAGVLRDGLIENKTDEDLEAVYDTKVGGLLNVLEALEDRPLKALLTFSSYSARYGRQGQADYAAANEVLNKLTVGFAQTHPECRCIAYNWGPWQGGMVDATLQARFAGEGMGLIPLQEGARQAWREVQLGQGAVEVLYDMPTTTIRVEAAPLVETTEAPEAARVAPDEVNHEPAQAAVGDDADMSSGRDSGVQADSHNDSNHSGSASTHAAIVLDAVELSADDTALAVTSEGQSDGVGDADATPKQAPAAEEGAESWDTIWSAPLNLETSPCLKSHILDGAPVVPTAVLAEWLAYGALHRHPGLTFSGFTDLQVLRGIVLPAHERGKPQDTNLTMSLDVGRSGEDGETWLTPVRLYTGVHDQARQLRAAAQIVLGPPTEADPVPIRATQLKPYPHSMHAVYQRLLFHGTTMRGLNTIEGISEEAMVATARAAPRPSTWLTHYPRSRWIADPLVLDAVFQLAVLWGIEHRSAASLPVAIASYRQYSQRFPQAGVRIMLRVVDHDGSLLRTDADLLNADGRCLAQLEGITCVFQDRLAEAFRNNQLSDAAPV